MCPGVWDVMTNMEVLEFVRKRIAEKMKPAQVSVHSISTHLSSHLMTCLDL